MPDRDADKHIAAAKTRLAHLSGLQDRTAQAEQRIHDAAVARRVDVDSDLNRLRPRVHLAGDAAEQYQALILERGQLDTVIANALGHHRT